MKHSPENFERAERCPVCLGSRILPYKKATFDYMKLRSDQIRITDREYGKIWDLSRCSACGHIFANPVPKPEFIFSIYSRVEDPLYDEEAEGRSRNFLTILKFLELFAPVKGTLFDVGAATGLLLGLARERGWNVAGIEASAWAAAFAARERKIALGQGAFEEAPLPANFYQAVAMVDFIEHTPKPREAALKAFHILAPGGILCLVTPDIHSLAAVLAGKRWWHLRPGHLAYFSRESLMSLLEDAGFRLLKMRRYAWTFSAHYLFSRMSFLEALAGGGILASFLKRIPIKLALGDSFEVYARKGVGS
jgi:SAM-dependent methyltransferase